MSKKGRGLLTGLVVGAGLGVLFAPKSGKDTRKDLAKKCDELWTKAKDIEFDDVKESIKNKITEIEEGIKDLDKEKVLEIAKKKGKEIEEKATDLYKIAVEKGTPIVEKIADEVRGKTVDILNSTIDKLEKNDKKVKKSAK